MKTVLIIVVAILLIVATYFIVIKTKPLPKPNSTTVTSLIPRVEMTCNGQKCLK